jgi:hypothetical protein
MQISMRHDAPREFPHYLRFLGVSDLRLSDPIRTSGRHLRRWGSQIILRLPPPHLSSAVLIGPRNRYDVVWALAGATGSLSLGTAVCLQSADRSGSWRHVPIPHPTALSVSRSGPEFLHRHPGPVASAGRDSAIPASPDLVAPKAASAFPGLLQ